MKRVAQALSVIWHPLLMPTYFLVLLLLINPYLFGVSTILEKGPLILLVFGSSFVIPGLVILMMLGLEMIPSLTMPNRQERIIPLIAVGMLYLGLFTFCKNAAEVPVTYTALVLGCIIGLFAGFFATLFTKVSLHAIGTGGLVGACFVFMELFADQFISLNLSPALRLDISISVLQVFSILTAGIVGSARLWLKAHNLQDLFGGYVLGLGSMLFAMWFWI